MTYPIDKVQFDIKRGLPQGDPATEPPGHGASRMGMWRNRANIRAPDVTETKDNQNGREIDQATETFRANCVGTKTPQT